MSNFLTINFKRGFVLGIILFLLAHVGSFLTQLFLMVYRDYNTPPEISMHVFWDIGFPFSIYYGMYGMYGFFGGNINFNGIAGNLLFGLALSFLLGLIFKFGTKAKPQKLK